MAQWGFKGVSRRKVPGGVYLRRLLNREIERGLRRVGRDAKIYAKTQGAPQETGMLRLAQKFETGQQRVGPWLALGWDVRQLQHTPRQTWKKLGGPLAPRKAKPPAAAAMKTVATKTPGAGSGGDGGLKPPRVGRGKFRTAEGPGKWFDYGTYQYMGRDWRSGRRLRYRMGGRDHWLYKHMTQNARRALLENRAIADALTVVFDRMWSCM